MRKAFSNPFRDLTKFEMTLYLTSMGVVTVCFLLSPQGAGPSLWASLVGVTALIFVAKGYVLGQVLTVVFALLYGLISLKFRYYGEMLTYLGMTAPMAVLSIVSWLRHPYGDTAEVEVQPMTFRQAITMVRWTAAVTAAFGAILWALDTAKLGVSTLSVSTSFLACYMTFLRSPWYALGYAANDLVLIALWTAAAKADPSCLPMTACFAMFFLNDLYALVNWRRMERRQREEKKKG